MGDLQQIAVTLQRKVGSGKVIVYTGTIAKSPHVVENNNTRTTQGNEYAELAETRLQLQLTLAYRGGGTSLNGCSVYPNHTPVNVYTVWYSLKCLHDASHRSIDKPPAS